MPKTFTGKLIWPVLPLLALMLMPSCVPGTTSATETAICGELRVDLPSYSSHDTAQSKAEGATFFKTFDAVCP